MSDISEEVIHLKCELEKVVSSSSDVSEVDGGEAADTNTMSEEEAEKLLVELLNEQQYQTAIHYMNKLRYRLHNRKVISSLYLCIIC